MSYLALDGQRIYFEWIGSDRGSEPVVFLHDGLGCTRSWKKLPGRIGESLECPTLNYDRCGYGRSEARSNFPPFFLEKEAASLRKMLDVLGIERVHLVGHSDGASISLLFAASNPDRVHSLVTEAPHTFVEKETLAGLQKVVRQGPEQLRWLPKFHPDRWRALFVAWTSSWLSQEHAGWDIRSCLPRIQAPILVVQGDRDEFATLAQVHEIERLAGKVRTWILRGCGHSVHGEHPVDFSRKVVAHIESVRSEPSSTLSHRS